MKDLFLIGVIADYRESLPVMHCNLNALWPQDLFLIGVIDDYRESLPVMHCNLNALWPQSPHSQIHAFQTSISALVNVAKGTSAHWS